MQHGPCNKKRATNSCEEWHCQEAGGAQSMAEGWVEWVDFFLFHVFFCFCMEGGGGGVI